MQGVAFLPSQHGSDDPQSSPSNVVLNPFDSLPVEVVSMVFICYVRGQFRRGPHASLNLGRICRRWRQIAWSTPHLWTNLELFDKQVDVKVQMPIELAEEWLSRASTLPLSIDLCFSLHPFHHQGSGTQAVLQLCKQILDLVIEYSDQWYSLSLHLPSSLLEGIGILGHPTSLLHHLSLEATWNDYDNFRVPHYPRSHTFSNCSPAIVKIAAFKMEINWRFVTDLTMDMVDIAEVLVIFRTANRLSKCSLDAVGHHGSDISTILARGLIECPALESLDISFDDDRPPTAFCNAISLPGLTQLSFGGYDTIPVNFFANDLVTFITRSFCALKSLHIDESEFERGSLIRLAPLLSSLIDLRIMYSPNDWAGNQVSYEDIDAFYHFLDNPDEVPTYIPPFTSFAGTQLPLSSLETFEWDGMKPFLWETVPGFLKPASVNGIVNHRPLKLVKITCMEVEEEDIIPYIPKDIIRQLSEFSDVKFEFTVYQRKSRDIGVDWWKASLERWDGSTDGSTDASST
ncbi:hypothetical protein CVT26_008645 [Gymnopilus dilepis]|uniref:F-box domain-containing protein n=1 Tax=Gymnopilus dilepis TaxID=231916 RepID=A0A409XXX1_9AGAR|nr:hypothetical protein CVT26_008645 [Gymnopilus dilepis]